MRIPLKQLLFGLWAFITLALITISSLKWNVYLAYVAEPYKKYTLIHYFYLFIYLFIYLFMFYIRGVIRRISGDTMLSLLKPLKHRENMSILFAPHRVRIDTRSFLLWSVTHESRFMCGSFRNCLVLSIFLSRDASGAEQLNQPSTLLDQGSGWKAAWNQVNCLTSLTQRESKVSY